MCAGVVVEHEAPCKGDAGGPLMYKDNELRKYIQVAIVEGAVGECGDKNFPAIFARLDHPSIWKFMKSIINLRRGTVQAC